MKKVKCLADFFPNLAEQWDYDKNGEHTPLNTPVGSHYNAYWICPSCHHSYQKRVSNRTAPAKREKDPNKCPYCRGYIIDKGFNSLQDRFPAIVKKEWDFERNKVTPDSIPAHSNKKFWWICPKGHHYEATPNNKVSGTGGNCPYCSHEKFSPEFSLAVLNPELAKEWNYTKNGKDTPATVFANSNKSVYWICSRCGHVWRAGFDNRNNGRGCPVCSRGSHTSFPEQAIYYYIRKLFPDAINSYSLDGKELDIYVPSINLGIEYDGENYHKTKEKIEKDIKKSEFFQAKGVHIVRFRESNCFPIVDNRFEIITFKYNGNYSDLSKILQSYIGRLCKEYSISIVPKVNVIGLKGMIVPVMNRVKYEDSFLHHMEQIEKCEQKPVALWDYEANGKLRPENFKPMSDARVHWICPNNPKHKWINTIKSVSLGYGCSICSKRHRYTTEEWIKKAKAIHGDKYDYSKVVYKNCKTPVTIICPIHGEFRQKPTEHLSGKGCKYCAGQAFHEKDSLASVSAKLAKEWDMEKNLEMFNVTPKTVSIHSTKKYWWHCNNGKPHSYQATIKQRRKDSGCAVCHGKQVSLETSLEYLHPELCSEWCPENTIKPSEVTPGSEKKVWWKCSNPNHPRYLAMIYNRAHLHSGCPLCGREKSVLNRKK